MHAVCMCFNCFSCLFSFRYDYSHANFQLEYHRNKTHKSCKTLVYFSLPNKRFLIVQTISLY